MSEPLWVKEFGTKWAVPEEITTHPKLTDVSWHNDVCPSFEIQGTDLRVFSDHPDVTKREVQNPTFRFWTNDGVVETDEIADIIYHVDQLTQNK